jgi:alpha-glucoside transport system substrate-binding protein
MRKYRLFAPLAVLALVLTACPAGDGDGDGDAPEGLEEGDGQIEVTSLWGGAEADAFQAVIDAFMAANEGIEVTYTSQREEYATVLNNRLAQGDPPDVAIIPGIGFLRSFAQDDLLIPLEDLGIDSGFLDGAYADSVAGVAQEVGSVNDTNYAVMVKLNSKSTIWYKPDHFDEMGWSPPATWDELLALTEEIAAEGITPWAVGAGDDWTLTDWFESVYLRQAGEEAYNTLFSAEGNWTDQSVLDAINTMTEIVNNEYVEGGINGALATNFTDGIGLVFSENAPAELYYEGGFVGGIALGDINPDLEPGVGIDFFDFPTISEAEGVITIGGDVMAAFNADTDVAAFMQYLASTEGGTVWAEGGTIISPMAGVEPSAYPNELAQKEAEQVANAAGARYDGSDLLPAGTSFGAVMQEAIQSPDAIEGRLEQFQQELDDAWADAEG